MGQPIDADHTHLGREQALRGEARSHPSAHDVPGAGVQAGGLYVHCAGQRVWVRDLGNPSAPAVLLIHGLGVHGDIWLPTVPFLLRRGLRVLVPDLPGHGRSDARRRASFSPRFHTRVLLALLDVLGVRRVLAIGNSLGGLLAVRLALAAPERIAGLVLVDAAGLAREGIPWSSRLAYLPAALPTLLGTSPSPVWLRLFLARMVVFDPVHVPELAHLVEACPPSPRAVRRTAMGLVGREGNVAHLLSRLHTPTLLVWGQEDRQIPLRQALEAERAIAGARLVRLAGAGHVPMWETPDAFRTAVEGFLAEVPGYAVPAPERASEAPRTPAGRETMAADAPLSPPPFPSRPRRTWRVRSARPLTGRRRPPALPPPHDPVRADTKAGPRPGPER